MPGELSEEMEPGLNRTSVGLKRTFSRAGRRRTRLRPQSNQRGIETVGEHGGRQEGDRGLNRTSVGLKRRTSPAPAKNS